MRSPEDAATQAKQIIFDAWTKDRERSECVERDVCVGKAKSDKGKPFIAGLSFGSAPKDMCLWVNAIDGPSKSKKPLSIWLEGIIQKRLKKINQYSKENRNA